MLRTGTNSGKASMVLKRVTEDEALFGTELEAGRDCQVVQIFVAWEQSVRLLLLLLSVLLLLLLPAATARIEYEIMFVQFLLLSLSIQEPPFGAQISLLHLRARRRIFTTGLCCTNLFHGGT